MTEAVRPRSEHVVTVDVDAKPYTSPKHTTVAAVLQLAGLDPNQRELVKVNGRHQTPYPDPTAELTLHDGEQFITVSIGPTPVS
jgi:hypothetical protein